ncbi:MAG: hypothetical protein GF388_03965 [Candidatus Aegiribacteria sp.]|nr:hypothetical protein [Candidatus Aegiribacteria sp.]
MNTRDCLILAAAAILLSSGALGLEDEDMDGAESGLAGLFRGLTEGTERAWAKPIEEVDMERMRELLEMGLIAFHEAEWYVKVEEDE